MGQTPTTLGDRFARRAAPEAKDHFRGQGPKGGAKKPEAFGKPVAQKGDAFAGGGKSGKPAADAFSKKPKPPVRAAAFTAPKPTPKPAPEPVPEPVVAAAVVAASKPEPVVVETKRAPLHVVPAQPQPQPEPRRDEPVEVKYQDVKREEAWRKRTARSSSLVLVTGSAAEAAADVAEAPPPVVTEPTPPPAAEPLPKAVVTTPPKRRGGGGGGAGSGGGGGTGAAAPAVRSFNQDDFVGIAFGAAVLTLLLLWLMRGGGGQPAAEDGTLAGVQFAATEPAVAPPPPAQPLVDPFGDQPVDLRPTGPIPEPAAEDPTVATAEAAPAPAPAAAPAAVPVADRTMRAWFCTKGSTLTTASKAALEKELAEFKSAFAGKELVVRGYADTRGTTIYNAALGGERARTVADFLRANGLNVVDSRGIGELDGLADNQNCANQRRVDVFVSGGPGEQPSRTCAPEPDVEDLVCG